MSGQELVCTDMASWHWGAAVLPWYHCTKTMCWTQTMSQQLEQEGFLPPSSHPSAKLMPFAGEK